MTIRYRLRSPLKIKMPYNPALDCRLKEPGYRFCEGACNCKKCWIYPRLGCYCFNFNKHLATHPQGRQQKVSNKQHAADQPNNQSARTIYHPPGTTTQNKLRLNNLKSPFSVDHPCPQCQYPLEVTPPGTRIIEDLPPSPGPVSGRQSSRMRVHTAHRPVVRPARSSTPINQSHAGANAPATVLDAATDSASAKMRGIIERLSNS